MIARLVSNLLGSDLDSARTAAAEALTARTAAEDNYAEDPTDAAYKRVLSARERADRAQLVLRRAEDRERHQAAAAAAAERAKMEAELADLVASTAMPALIEQAAEVRRRHVAIVQAAADAALSLSAFEADVQARLERGRELAERLGVPFKATDNGLAGTIRTQASHDSMAIVRGLSGQHEALYADEIRRSALV